MERDETEITTGAEHPGEQAEPPAIRGMETVRLLGTGSAAVVWLVRRTGSATAADVRWTAGEEELPERFALKMPREVGVQGDGPAARRRLCAELEAMRPLHHDHLVRAWGIAETQHGPGLLLDLCQAGSLYGVVGISGGLTPGEAVTVLSPVAEAVGHLHRMGAVHGDVQPSNVLLAPDGRPALSDLGEAQLLGMPRSQAGAVGFLAPEHWAEEESSGAEQAELACAADVYALGTLGWFALTGEAPAAGRSRPPLGTLRPEVPQAMVELLEEALSEHPEDRPTAEEFARDLWRSAEAEPLDLGDHVDDEVLPELPTRMPPGDAPAGRSRRRRLIGAATGLVLLGALGWGAWSIAAGPEGMDSASAPAQDPLVEAREMLTSEEAADVLPGIAQLRTAALEESDQEIIEDYAQAGSPAAEADAELLEEMAEAGLAYEGSPMTIEPLEDAGATRDSAAEEARIDVLVTATDFESGDPITQQVTLTLRREETHWLLTEVTSL